MQYIYPGLLLFLFYGSALELHAQYDAGGVYFSQQTNLTYFDNGELRPFGFSTSRIGVLPFANLMVGIEGSVSTRLFQNGGESADYFVRPFARYYLPINTKGKLSYFGQIGFGTFTNTGFEDFSTDFSIGGGCRSRISSGRVCQWVVALQCTEFGHQ